VASAEVGEEFPLLPLLLVSEAWAEEEEAHHPSQA